MPRSSTIFTTIMHFSSAVKGKENPALELAQQALVQFRTASFFSFCNLVFRGSFSETRLFVRLAQATLGSSISSLRIF